VAAAPAQLKPGNLVAVRVSPILLAVVALGPSGCARFLASGEGNSPYFLIALGVLAAFFGERRIKADGGGAVGWTLRIIGIVLFLLG
jgi:hypothetical protein